MGLLARRSAGRGELSARQGRRDLRDHARFHGAVDAITGKQIWRVKYEYPPETLRVVCCGIVNRGAALFGRFFPSSLLTSANRRGIDVY
jgi:hypothetical protein